MRSLTASTHAYTLAIPMFCSDTSLYSYSYSINKNIYKKNCNRSSNNLKNTHIHMPSTIIAVSQKLSKKKYKKKEIMLQCLQ